MPFKLNKEPSSKQHTLYSQTLLAEPNTTKSWNNPFHTGTQKPQNPLGQIFRTTRRRQLEALPDDPKKNQLSNPQAQLIVDPDIRQYITIPMMMVITSSNEITGGQIFRTTRRRQLQALPDDPKPQIPNLLAQLIAGPDLRQYTTIPMMIVITSRNGISRGQIFRTDDPKPQISNLQAQLIAGPDLRQYTTIPMMIVITSSNVISRGQIFRTTRRRQLQALPEDPKPQISNLQAQLIAGPDFRQYTTIPMMIVITSRNGMTRRRNGVRAPGWMKRFGRVGAKLTNISRK